jgi:hypothetical protein
MSDDPVEYIDGEVIGEPGEELTLEELELVSGGSIVLSNCPGRIICPPGYTRCVPYNRCSP